MKILIPVNKRRVKDSKCAERALMFHLKKRNGFGIRKADFDIVIEREYVYYPYWISTVHTVKARALPIYPDKAKDFYITCDALEGNFIVLQNIPKLREAEADPQNILQEIVTQEEMQVKIYNEALSDRINRQFIFGPPQAKPGVLRMIYLPMLEVKIREKGRESFRTYFVNIYTGEVKAD